MIIFYKNGRKNDKGFFISGAEIVCFIIINVLMLASFGLGSSIRKTQDAKYLARQLAEQEKQREAEAAREKARQTRENRSQKLQNLKNPPKAGALAANPGAVPRGNIRTSIITYTPEQSKKLIAAIPEPPRIIKKTPAGTKTLPQTASTSKTDEISAAVKTAAVSSPDESNNASSFNERMASLFSTDIDSLGVEIYDYKIARNTAGKEIAVLRLINALKLEAPVENAHENKYHLAVSTGEVTCENIEIIDDSADETLAASISQPGGEAPDTGKNSAKIKKIAAKFLYNYKSHTYIATNNGLFFAPIAEISELDETGKAKKSRITRYPGAAAIRSDIIAIAGEKELLFAAGPSTVYMIDLNAGQLTDIGIDELFENSSWYSIFYYDDKLYLANYEALFYYDVILSRWFTVAYEKFAGFKKCELQNFIIYKQPGSLAAHYMLVTRDYGVITDKLPSFDPAAFKYKTNLPEPRILKKIFNRNILKTPPAFVYNEPESVWFSFEPQDKEPYELIRFDKKNEKYERHNKADKLKCVYAIDMTRYNDNLMFAVNGEELFAVIRMWGDDNAKIYGFYPIASISGCFSVSCFEKFVICGTLNGEIYKINVSDLIESAEKL